MSKSLKLNKNIALICVVLLTACIFSGFTYADASSAVSYDEISIYMDGIFVFKGYKIENTTYVPVRAFCEAFDEDIDVSWDYDTQTAMVKTEGLTLTASEEDNYITANGRYLYVPDGVKNLDGTIVVPVREISKAFGVAVNWNSRFWTIDIDTTQMAYIHSDSEFYNADDLYWLSRVINAESLNQPIEGKIAVGNVVINRVADVSCPDTIYDVIFDKKHGVQFSVTTNGSIYMDPSDEAIVAAKICLEGYNVVGNSLYFVNPDIGVSSWFVNTRTFIKTIADHDFYA